MRLTGDQVLACLDTIERKGRILRDLSGLEPDPANWTTWAFPRPFKFTVGPGVVVKEIKSISSTVKKLSELKLDANTANHCLSTLSHTASVSFNAWLTHKETGRLVGGSLSFVKGMASVTAGGVYPELKPLDLAVWGNYVAEIAGLPVRVRCVSGENHIVEHTQGGSLLEATFDKKRSHVSFECELPGLSAGEALDKFLNFAGKNVLKVWRPSWSILWNLAPTSSEDVLAAFDRVEMPGKDIVARFRWVLRSYENFEELAELAARECDAPKIAHQRLLEFELSGCKAELAVSAWKNSRFHISLTTASKQEAEEIAKQFGLEISHGCLS